MTSPPQWNPAEGELDKFMAGHGNLRVPPPKALLRETNDQ